MRTNAPLLLYTFLLSIFSHSLYGKNKIDVAYTFTDLSLEVHSFTGAPLKTSFNTVYIEDYGAVANDGLDDGIAFQLAVDANVAGTINYIKSRTGGKFVIASGSVNLDGVRDLYFELQPNAEIIVIGNFPAFTSIFNNTPGDVSITNIVFDGFKIGSEYDANINGGNEGSKGGDHYGSKIANGADPNPLNPAVIWIGGVRLDGFTFKNMEITNPLTNGYGIKLHNETGTAFTKNVKIFNNHAHDIGGMFLEIVNQNSPSEYRFENVEVYGNDIDNLGIFGHGIAISLAGTGRNLDVHHNTYSNLYFGFELVGGNDVHWHDETFLQGIDHFWSFSKDAAVATGFNSNITVDNISGKYPTAGPSIVGYVENATFTNIQILGNGLGGIEVRHSKNITFINPKITAANFGMFLFTGDDAINSQVNQNIRIVNPELHGTSSGGNPILAGLGDQIGDVTIVNGKLSNDVGPLWIASGSTAEPKYENVSTEINGIKEILNPSSVDKADSSNSIEFSEVPMKLIGGDSVEVSVKYTIRNLTAKILVKLENPFSIDSYEIVKKRGEGNYTFKIAAPGNSGSGYRWLAQILSEDGNEALLAEQVVEGITVDGVETAVTSNSIEFSEVPLDVIVGDSVDVTVNYTISDPSAYVVVQLKSPNGEKLEDYVISSGSGSHTFTIPVTGSSGSGYSWNAQLLLGPDGNWAILAEQVVEGITVDGVETAVTSNSIEFSEVPLDVIVGDSVDVTVNYTISEPSAYVVVQLKSPNGEKLEDYVIRSGSGSQTFTIPVTGSSDSGYSWTAQLLLGTEENWAILDEQIMDGVSVTGSETPTDDTIDITATPNNVGQGKYYEIGFDYSFTGARWLQIWMTNKVVNDTGSWERTSQAYKRIDAGAGNDFLSIQVTGQPSESNLLFVQVFEVVNVNGVNVWKLVIDKKVNNIGLEEKNEVAGKEENFKDFSVSPNPFNNFITYEYSIRTPEIVRVALFNINGLKVKNIKQGEHQNVGNYSETVDTTDLDSGIYILRKTTSSGNEEIRLIKN